MEGDGLRAEGEFLVFIWLVSITDVWFQLECAPEQLVSMVTVNWHFLCCHVFPVVSELVYLLLEHVVN